jgi:hypothetical protein
MISYRIYYDCEKVLVGYNWGVLTRRDCTQL